DLLSDGTCPRGVGEPAARLFFVRDDRRCDFIWRERPQTLAQPPRRLRWDLLQQTKMIGVEDDHYGVCRRSVFPAPWPPQLRVICDTPCPIASPARTPHLPRKLRRSAPTKASARSPPTASPPSASAARVLLPRP